MREIGVLQVVAHLVKGREYQIEFDRQCNDGEFRIRVGDNVAAPELRYHYTRGFTVSGGLLRATETGRQAFLLTREAEEPGLLDSVRLTVRDPADGVIASAFGRP